MDVEAREAVVEEEAEEVEYVGDVEVVVLALLAVFSAMLSGPRSVKTGGYYLPGWHKDREQSIASVGRKSCMKVSITLVLG